MRLGGSASGLRFAFANGGVDGGMLVFEQRTGRWNALQLTQIEVNVVVHQPEQGSRKVAEQGVMRRVTNRLMKSDVGG